MTELGCPWTGLTSLAMRRDLWAVLDALGGPHAAEGAGLAAWCAAGLDLGEASAVLREGPWRGAGVHAAQPEWPALLRDLPRGPVALAAEGNLSLLEERAVAIVGARACTSYGRTWARRLAHGVVDAGGVVVSGLAHGIDEEAHLASRGRTIAVLGQGLAARMPAWQERVRERVLAEGGLLLSEFAPDLPATKWTFPVRNRIIAGLARAVVVVEAGEHSGAGITARRGVDFGREVLVVPGPLDAPASVGCLDLLESGVGMVRGTASVVKAAGLDRPAQPRDPESRVIVALAGGATPEDVALRTGYPHAVVVELLGLLQLTGRVSRLPGRRYMPT